MIRPAQFSIAVLTVIAACGGSESPTGTAPATNTVSSVAVTITVSGATIIESGKATRLTAIARNSSGTEISGKAFTWASTNESVATAASDGTVTAHAVGTATISAAADGKSGTLGLTVGPAPSTVTSIVISGAATVQAGTTTKLTAILSNAAGTPVAVTPSWSSSDPTLVSIDADGVATALRIGTVVITASAGASSSSFALASQLTPFTFAFDAGSSQADQQVVKDVFLYAYPYLRDVLALRFTCSTLIVIPGCLPSTILPQVGATKINGVLSSPLCDSRIGNAARTDASTITICMASTRWLASGPVFRQKIVAHELHHRFQAAWNRADGQPNAGPEWMFEGIAELAAASSLAARGLLSLDVWRSCAAAEIAEYATRQPPGIPNLETLEANLSAQGTPGPVHALTGLAIEQLSVGKTLYDLHTWINDSARLPAGVNWQSRFITSFSQSATDFYVAAPAYVKSIPAPPPGACSG
ncbi:MAG: Ig-like domain-containing protein [Gemmatimonadota bacterium]